LKWIKRALFLQIHPKSKRRITFQGGSDKTRPCY
jgi:hypothetical protein